MDLAITVLVVLIIGFLIWRAAQASRDPARQAALEIDRLKGELRLNEEKRQQVIDDAAGRGVKISIDAVLKPVEELRAKYLEAGMEADARAVERVISETRERYGSEIQIDEAYRLMKKLEDETGMQPS